MTISDKAIDGIDASRRAGWARAYAAESELEALRNQPVVETSTGHPVYAAVALPVTEDRAGTRTQWQVVVSKPHPLEDDVTLMALTSGRVGTVFVFTASDAERLAKNLLSAATVARENGRTEQ